ncbi:uncharacterized protein LOC123548010 [Mercenaria mercenaria]|uniref:uncharacterized protein LOC123548010 n=1 Tax=Mercenaria mercenaria TaxID=6596 RepID=UPI001E1DDCC0|nr:uncharacterized protein LOC123548010 [Mercenaria mercenaria]
MNDYGFCILILLFTIIQHTTSSLTSNRTHHWTCPPSDANFHYNLCSDPIHPHTTFYVGNTDCNLDSGFKNNLRRITLEMSDGLQDEMSNFNAEHVRCEYRLQQLQQKNLTNILRIETSYEFERANSITTVYTKMAKFLRLHHKLWCLYSVRAKQECCLSFTENFRRLKHRLLGKWWIVQNSCGEQIDQNHCEASVQDFTTNDLRCEDLRDIIYILFRDARSLLNESLSVLDQF